MQIVSERIVVPRPLQRPSDIEMRPSDFGIESPPPAPPKPAATIVKSALSPDPVFEGDPGKNLPDDKASSPKKELPPEEADLDFDLP